MQLVDYLREKGLSYRRFAQLVGSPHGRTIESIVKRRREASAEMMRKIYAATGGVVTPNDLVLQRRPVEASSAEAVQGTASASDAM